MTIRPPSKPPSRPAPKPVRRGFKEKPVEATRMAKTYQGRPRRSGK